jgi:hypothetical protein
MLGREARQRFVVHEQALAPGLEPPVRRGRPRRASCGGGKPRADRFRIHFAHQSPDVLQLTAPRLVAPDALCIEHRLEQPGFQLHCVEL